MSCPQLTRKGQLCASEESWFRCIDLPTIQLRGNGTAEWRSIRELKQERGRRATIERGSVTSRYHGSKKLYITTIESLSKDDKGQQRERQITLFCTFLSRRCKNATWNFLISRARSMELMNTAQKFSFSELTYGGFGFNPREFRRHLSKLNETE